MSTYPLDAHSRAAGGEAMSQRCCATCRHWGEPEIMSKVSEVAVAKCQWPVPPLPIANLFPLLLGFTSGDKGKDCPCWEERT
jgi:hypothetical protein